MTTPPSDRPATLSWKPLDPRQRRVLGVLIEKAKTTPAGYPMSVNAIVAGCNQKNNRDPVTTYDDFGVEKALDELRTLGAVSEIDWLGRVSKWKHQAYEWLGVSKVELAVLAELLLRGAQTLGELRARAARMEPIADLAALKPVVDGLLQRGLMVELSRSGRGQVVSHNLYPGDERAALDVEPSGKAPARAAVGHARHGIHGVHALIYSRKAEALRAFFRDVLEWPHVDAGQGWLIFALPPAELAAHPSEDETHCELYLMCEDVEATVASLREKGVEATEPIADRGFGLMTAIRLPDGSTMGLYQPKHPTAIPR